VTAATCSRCGGSTRPDTDGAGAQLDRCLRCGLEVLVPPVRPTSGELLNRAALRDRERAVERLLTDAERRGLAAWCELLGIPPGAAWWPVRVVRVPVTLAAWRRLSDALVAAGASLERARAEAAATIGLHPETLRSQHRAILAELLDGAPRWNPPSPSSG
jgi:hypothetical protein